MGVKPYAIASSVSLIIAQRLAQAVRPVPPGGGRAGRGPSQGRLPEEDVAAGIKLFTAKGCNACTDGYKGRVGIYQVMPVTEEIGRIIMAGGSAIEVSDQAEKEGVWDLRRAGLAKVKAGLTSLEEVNSVTTE